MKLNSKRTSSNTRIPSRMLTRNTKTRHRSLH